MIPAPQFPKHVYTIIGFEMALLTLPVVYSLQSFLNVTVPPAGLVIAAVLWVLVVSLVFISFVTAARLLLSRYKVAHELFFYTVVGVLNTLLYVTVFNLFLFFSGIVRGPLIVVFSALTLFIVITHAFFWNKYVVFYSRGQQSSQREYVGFFTISLAVAILNITIIALLINGVGPQWGLSPYVWANVAVGVTIPIAFLGNFLGYKFLVFR